jgi:dipeptidyl aminopeptidase/acylaminoacyl peptidase
LIDSLNQVKTVRETALSPDGKYIVWNVGGRGGSDLELAPLDNPSAARRITACEGGGRGANRGQESNAVFSPDSRQIAFFSDCNADHKMAVFLTDASGLADASGVSAPHQLAGLNGFAKEMQWSPDGKRLSFLYVEGATRPSGALAAEKPPSGVIGVEGLEVQRVATVDAASGQLTQITPAKLHVFEFDWSPDSTKLAYVAAPPPGENNWWVAKLYTEPVIERIEFGGQNGRRSVVGGAAQPILDPPTVAGPLHGLQIAVPRWSQDGQQIAFIGGLMSDQG